MTQDDDDDEISRREKVGRSGGVELVKPASPRLVSKPSARRERLTRGTKRDDDGSDGMLRRPRRRCDGVTTTTTTTTTMGEETTGASSSTSSLAVGRVPKTALTRRSAKKEGWGEDELRGGGGGFVLRGNDGGRDIKRRFGRFLARIEPPSRLDTESIKEAVKDMRSKTESALKEIKVPNVEDLRNLIDDIRAEQSEAKYHPDRRRLSNVADFFAYTEEEGAGKRAGAQANSQSLEF